MNTNVFKLTGISALLLSSVQAWADGAAPAGQEGGLSQTVIMIGVALIFFYFILWRPEQKRRKTMEKQRNSMKVGDRVTAMGMIGTIAKIQEHTLIIKTYDDSKIEILKSAITDVKCSSEEGKPEIVESNK